MSPGRCANRCDAVGVLNCANLIVYRHRRHTKHVLRDYLGEEVAINSALSVDGQSFELHFVAVSCCSGGRERALMLDCGDEDPSATDRRAMG